MCKENDKRNKLIEILNAGIDPPIILFPEGTTANGHVLCKFFPGGFVVGSPVQPVRPLR